LLIGALMLALLAGVLIFALLANAGEDNGTTSSAASGDVEVLVARDTINAGDVISADDFRTASVTEENAVPQAVTDVSGLEGLVARTDILKGQQLSRTQIGSVAEDDRAEQLAFKFQQGYRAVSVSVDEISAVGGLLVPGDRVDIIATIEEQQRDTDRKFVRIQTVLQNVEVLARAQTPVDSIPQIGEDGKPIAPVAGETDLIRRPEDIEADAGAGSVTLLLSPQEVQRVRLADHLGEISLSLRPYGDTAPTPIEDIVVEVVE
jgi:pilus assembly protein CpaB